MTDIIIATIMRPTGETGVQTHFNCFREYLAAQQLSHQLLTPFSYRKYLVYPVFGMRKILHKLSGPLSVWWYRHWHKYFLRLVLQQKLQSGADCVIYAQCPLAADAALRARRSAKQRVVMVTHFNISQADEWAGKGLISNGDQLFQAIQNFEARVLPQLDGLVFVSEFMQRELVKRIPAISSVNATVVPNFLPDPGLPAAQPAVADLINIGTLEARKNQQYLLDIIAALRAQGTALTLTLVGDGPDMLKLKEKAKALQINDLVRFAGFVANAAELINMHKACVHVASIENLPITLIEAIARGRPVFAAPVGGVGEILGNNTAGLALPLHDAPAAAKLIAEAMNDPTWMTKTGQAARTRFLDLFANEVSAKNLARFLLTDKRQALPPALN
jgi:glycosyltransferase involved in cell wall biosynthesis